MLWPVITRATYKKGHRRVMRLGDDELELHPDFRLYLHTKLSNPHFPPEVQVRHVVYRFHCPVCCPLHRRCCCNCRRKPLSSTSR